MLSGDNLTIVLFLIGTAITLAVAAMSQAGWKHPLLIYSLFFLAAVFAAAGLGWPILKTISEPVTATVNQIATNPVAWFVVLMLGMGATLFHPNRDAKISETSNPLVRTPSPSAVVPIAVPVIEHTTESPKEEPREFVDTTPEYLLGLRKEKNRTQVQTDKLVEPYLGKWIRVSGTIYDIYDSFVVLRDGEESSAVYLMYDMAWKDKFHLLEKRKIIFAIGKIHDISSDLQLKHCELVQKS
jgi:hypothetical protein